MRLGEYVLQTAREYPERTALIFRDQMMQYRELATLVQRLAAGLVALGISTGDRIGLLLPNCPPFVLGYFAGALLDSIVVPANPMLKPAELAYIWADVGINAVITVPQLLTGVQEARRSVPGLKHVIGISPREESGTSELLESITGFVTLPELLATGAQALARNPLLLDRPPVDENSCAVIIYTSGTTGYPKGAMLSHKNLRRNVEQARQFLEIHETDVFLTVLPLFHSFSGTVCMNIPLMTGSTSVLMENFAPGRVLDVLEMYGVTLFPGVPALFHGLLAFPTEREYDFSRLRIIVSGGAPLPANTLQAVEKRFKVPVLEGDGPTECSPATSVNPIHGVRKVGSVGIPIPGVEIAIFDEQDNPLPVDTVGEIVVRGDNVMLGYLNQPEATAEAMSSGWYHTGDLGRIDSDGYIFIMDRKKDMIITSGLNVYPREVEEVLFLHSAVADCAVIGQLDALRGEEVVAVVVLKPGEAVTERALASHCREMLANYKVPRRVLFRESLPRGATGKVVKRLLKKELDMDLTQN